MSTFGLSPQGLLLFDLVRTLKQVEKEDFILDLEDPCLLEVPMEQDLGPKASGLTQAFDLAAFNAEGMSGLETMKVRVEDLKKQERSKDVTRARIYLLKGVDDRTPVSIGRAEDCTVVLDTPGVSRKHAQIHKAAGNWQVEDLGSNNGTFLNGKQIGANERHTLTDRQSVWFSSFRAVFLFPEGVYDLCHKLRNRA